MRKTRVNCRPCVILLLEIPFSRGEGHLNNLCSLQEDADSTNAFAERSLDLTGLLAREQATSAESGSRDIKELWHPQDNLFTLLLF